MPDGLGYARLSINADGKKISCDVQEADVRAEAERNGDQIIHVYRDDSASAWDPNTVRDDFEKLMERLVAGDPASRRLYIPHVDRFVRQIYDLGRILRHRLPGTVVYSDHGQRFDLDNGHDRFRLTLDAAHAALSSDDTSRRTRRGLQERAERGAPHGGRRPFGYRRGVLTDDRGAAVVDARGNPVKTLIMVADEAAVVREVFDGFVKGRSVRSMASELAAAVTETFWRPVPGGAVRPVYRPQWSDQEVRGILRSPSVGGFRRHGWLEVPADGSDPLERERLIPANWPPIVDPVLWREVQATFADRTVAWPRSAPDRYLLSGLVWCGRCGQRMGTQPASKSTGRLYRCRPGWRPSSCGGVSVSAARLDELVGGWLAVLVANPSARRTGDLVAARRARAEGQLAEAKGMLAQIARDYGARRITVEERDVSRADPAARLVEAERVLAERAPDVRRITGGRPWGRLGPDERRAVAHDVIREIRVAPAVRRGRKFDDSRVVVDWR